MEIQLLHAIVRDLRLFQSKAAPGQVNVRRSYIRTSEVEASIVVRSNASRIRSRGSLVFFVGRVQHQLHAFEPQQRPIEVFSLRLGRSHHVEPQHIAVERDGRRHVKHLQQRSHPSYLNAHIILRSHSNAVVVLSSLFDSVGLLRL